MVRRHGDLASWRPDRWDAGAESLSTTFNRAMMAAGLHKVRGGPLGTHPSRAGKRRRDCFSDRSFDAAMVGFGIRNVTRMRRRSLKCTGAQTGGKLMCLEFSRPMCPIFRWLYIPTRFHYAVLGS